MLLMRCWQTVLLLAALPSSLALAEDFKTLAGKEYKDVTVTRVEPDGIVLKGKGGFGRFSSLNYPKTFKNVSIMMRQPRRQL